MSGVARMYQESDIQPCCNVPANEGPWLRMIYFGACLIAGIRLAREKQVNVRVIPTSVAIEEQWISRMRFTIVCFAKCQRV